MPSTKQFFLNFLKAPFRNASVVPSSQVACRAMVEGIPWDEVEYIVELGPGTGVFTEHIVRCAKNNAKLLAIELEESYINSLEQRFGLAVEIVHASAHQLDELVEGRDWPRIDLVISGLPFNLPHEVRAPLFEALKRRIQSGMRYRCFTYCPPGMKRAYRDFSHPRPRLVWRNFPPMWIYEPKG